MVLEWVKPRHQSDQWGVVIDSKFLSYFAARLRIRAKTTGIKSIRDDLHLVRRESAVGVHHPGMLRTADNARGQIGEHGTGIDRHECRPLGDADNVIGMMDSPDNGGARDQFGSQGANQVGMVHPGLDHIRLGALKVPCESKDASWVWYPRLHPHDGEGNAGIDDRLSNAQVID